VTKDKEAMNRMLRYTKGQRLVPVVVEASRVQIGYAGGS
jgi:hypothetical protein